MKRFSFYGLILAALVTLSLGCSNEKKLLRQQVAAQADSLFQLRGNLQAKADSLQNAISSLSQTRLVVDSVTGENDSFRHRIGQLNSRVSQLKKDNDNLQATVDKASAVKDSLTAYYMEALTDSSNILSRLRSDVSLADMTVDRRDTLLAQIGPWYMKWKHDAHRGFFKVLFGAGKAKNPGFPEPDLTPSDNQ
jgi:chromosome segregation ATPase